MNLNSAFGEFSTKKTFGENNMKNRNYKDSVFVDLFAKDITAKENFVSLYNALHETNLDYKTTEVKPVMIE